MMICPECKNEKDCGFCENTGEVSEKLAKLHNLGFRETSNQDGVYRLFIQKALNQIETISVEIVIINNDLALSKIKSSGSSNLIEHNKLDSVESVINFLYSN